MLADRSRPADPTAGAASAAPPLPTALTPAHPVGGAAPVARRDVVRPHAAVVRRGVALGIAVVVASAVLEWFGWRIVWRHGGAPPAFDAAWGAAFFLGTARTAVLAGGVGAALALATGLVGRVREWHGLAVATRALWAFAAGAAVVLAALAGLTAWAP